MNGWGKKNSRNNNDSSDDEDDYDNSNHGSARKGKKKLGFLQKNNRQDDDYDDHTADGGREGKASAASRVKGLLRMSKSTHSAASYDDSSYYDEDRRQTTQKPRSRFSPGSLKRSKSADDSGYGSSNRGSSHRSPSPARGVFRKRSNGGDPSYSVDSDEDESVHEKEVRRGGKKKMGVPGMGGFLRKAVSEGHPSPSKKGRPPLAASNGNRPRKPSTDSGSIHPNSGKGVSFNVEASPHRGPKPTISDESDMNVSLHGPTAPNTPTQTKKPTRERARYSVYHGAGPRAVKRKFRVRPYRAFTEPTYMNEEEIYADSLQPTKTAEMLKSYLVPSTRTTKNVDVPDHVRALWGTPNYDGRIGSIRMEVLGCISLNRTKPDVAVYAVCGDTAFCTDIIQGYRSPMWPSACKRAAVFPLHHAFAKVYIGVFDVRKRANKDNDVFCGRVVLDIANTRPNTDYDVTLPLRVSTFVYDKRKRGVIRVRFSVNWFSERAAVMSYFRGVHTVDDNNPLVAGNPTIPCADPRSFRNVAFTVHGHDLPGKYSKVAFRATVREMNLYQINLRRTLLVSILDVMFYENKIVSILVFASAMFLVYLNSVAHLPAMAVGYVLMQYLNNYRHYVHKSDFNLGYKPLTIYELGRSVLQGKTSVCTDPSKHCMAPIEVDKWTKKRGNNKYKNLPAAEQNADSADEKTSLLADEGKEVRPLDHREFIYSQRDAYPFFAVEDSLAPGSSKGDTGRLHGRLSVYYAAPEGGAVANADGDEEVDDDDESDHDDDTVMTESQMMGDDGFDMDSGSDEDDEDNLNGVDINYRRAAEAQKLAKGKQRIMARVALGPPQDSDVKGKKVPPQETLKKLEHRMYKLSGHVSVEFVHSGPQNSTDGADFAVDTGMTQPSKELKSKMLQKAKKSQADEYDKILGYSVSYTNPIQRIMSSFMGPVMRMMRVGVYTFRISYNLSAWRDPILSFWLLVFLTVLFLVLIVFPWRAFFFLTSVITIGPQNLFLRKILERKAREMEEKKKAVDDEQSIDSDGTSSKKKKKTLMTKALARFNHDKKYLKEVRDTLDPASRVVFSTTGTTVTTSAKQRTAARAVVVPYSRLRKDRFWSWPPDPTVSRATPVPLFDAIHDDDSMTLSGPEPTMDEFDDDIDLKTPSRQQKPTLNGSVNMDGSFIPPPDIAF